MHIPSDVVVSFLGGSGLGYTAVRLFMKNEAREALKSDLLEIHNEIKDIKNNYVDCKVCLANHSAIDRTLANIEKKVDILLEKAI